jgi:hypothetical protein
LRTNTWWWTRRPKYVVKFEIKLHFQLLVVIDGLFCFLLYIKIIKEYSNQTFTQFGRILVSSSFVEEYIMTSTEASTCYSSVYIGTANRNKARVGSLWSKQWLLKVVNIHISMWEEMRLHRAYKHNDLRMKEVRYLQFSFYAFFTNWEIRCPHEGGNNSSRKARRNLTIFGYRKEVGRSEVSSYKITLSTGKNNTGEVPYNLASAAWSESLFYKLFWLSRHYFFISLPCNSMKS